MKLDELIVRVEDYNNISTNAELLKKLRKMTLDHFSGMNYELNNFDKISKTREVMAKIFLAYFKEDLVAWAILSKEPTDYLFKNIKPKAPKLYDPSYGYLFQVYVDFPHRQRGIGGELLKIAKRKASPYKLFVCPWNTISKKFYKNIL